MANRGYRLGMRQIVAGIMAVLVGATVATFAPLTPQAAQAAPSGSEFQPGNIITDANFYDGGAMTEAQIQSFLNARIGTCQNTNCLNIKRVDTTSRTADPMCNAYQGAASEPVSRIIFKVQQACGISAKVLLVTLQKEQSLVTHTSPSDSRLDRAMGYFCPDDPSRPGWCNPTYAGVYNQLYRAAWQMKRYGNPPGTSNHFTWYPVGKTSQVGYHPNTACGSRSVLITNKATAALYYYTPYTPNGAALANLYGTGDGCSSYGNRNFWRMYHDWFGDPLGVNGSVAIAAAFASAGGVTGPLGAIVTRDNCRVGDRMCFQRHANGSIYWTIGAGAFPVLGAYDTAYRAIGELTGPMGGPTTAYIDVPANPNGAGGGQHFQSGTIYSSAAGAFAVLGPIRAEYWAEGGNPGSFGWPTSDRRCVGALCAQEFQGGAVGQSGTTAFTVVDDYWATYRANGGVKGSLGLPSGAVIDVPTTPNGPGSGQPFQNGTIYATAAHGAHAVAGTIRSTYWKLGSSSGAFGWPLAAQSCFGSVCGQPFEGGHVFSNGLSVGGDYSVVYNDAGGMTGTLGLPTSPYIAVTNNPNGSGGGQHFQNGSIYSSAAGAFPAWGAVRAEWWRLGGNGGQLGWPTGNPVCANGLCSQSFQAGTLTQTSTSTVALQRLPRPEYASVHEAFKAQLGLATSWYIAVTKNPNGSGGGQHFQNGSIYSSAAGAFPTWGAIRAEWWRLGGNGGQLGWPTGNPVCANGLCSQSFQKGTLTQTSASTVVLQHVPHPEYKSVHEAFKAQLGLATSWYIAVTKNPNGSGGGQHFQNGSIYSSGAGAFPTWGAIRAEWWRLGGNAGPLGWPTGNPVCADGLCSQTFQGGTISR